MADDAPETAPAPPPMIGSYRLVEPLGSGGMSSVFRALHKDTGSEVAVKVLPRYLAKNPTLLQRFLREAKSAESLEDPNIVAIYDRGSEAGRHYLVLEYVPGGDLHDLVRERGPMPIREAMDAIRQVAHGLRHAAGRGLIHRDIKPANILRTPDGRVKVTDLGLALQMEDEDERVTRDGTTVGTVDYMAPEQARDSRAASVKSDIYSLGCTFYFLVTGSPPFQGGDVAEKLRAHATEPPPDAHKTRPEVPAILARLIQKMMAKRPEKRFADYDQLLDTLDAVAASLDAPAGGASESGPLMALIDEEDDDQAGPLMALIDEEEGKGGPLLALIDDDDEEGYTLGPGPMRSPGSTGSAPSLESWGEPAPKRGSRADFSPGDVDFSKLGALEEESPALPSRRPKSSAISPAASGSRLEDVPAPPPEEAYDLGPQIPTPVHLYQMPAPAKPGIPLETWIVRISLLTLVALVTWFGWSQFSPRIFDRGAAPPLETGTGTEGESGESGAGAVASKPAPWREPEDRDEPPAPEPTLNGEALARLGMTAAADEAAPRVEAPYVTVRRVNSVMGSEDVPDLPRAFDKIGGVVEIGDDGPIYEENLRISGESRVIRARPRDKSSPKSRPDYRPIIVVARPETAAVKARPASFVLGKQKLVIEGIDFVINGADLSARQESLFLCKDSELTLRDCTFTIVGPIKHSYAIVQVGERGVVNNAAASKIRFERTRIRGLAAAVRLAGEAEVTFARSAVTDGNGPAIIVAGEAKAARSVAIFRTILASRGPLISLVGTAGSADALPMTVRAYESTFASIGAGPQPPPFVGLSEVPAGPARARPLVTWRGESNRFDGWGGWSSAAPQGVLATIRSLTPEAERQGNETSTSWPEEAADPWAVPTVPATVATALASPPVRVARPTPLIREKTLGTFSRLSIGGPTEGGAVQSLTFNADDETWNGDLGRFLAGRPKSSARRVRVTVTGSGRHDSTPIVMPVGVSLEIAVGPPVASGSPALVWTTPEGSMGEALFVVKGAELSITGARITGTPKSQLRFLASVENGNMFLSRCILMGPGEVENETKVGGLVSFKTDGTRPFPESSGANRPLVDRPTCLLTDCALITGGDCVTASVGRGVVALTNCAMAAEASAFVLQPQPVRRDRFEADLVLDRCTIAAEKNIVHLDSWPGLATGPDRPWVIWSTACVFSDAYQRGGGLSRGVALRTEIGGLDRGALAWQSSNDAYDLSQFAVASDLAPPPGRADIRRAWIDLMGPSHILSPRAEDVRFLVDRLRPGEISPGDLALDPTYPSGRKSPSVGADLAKMGVAPTVAKFRPSAK